jgi:hypothetical protein
MSLLFPTRGVRFFGWVSFRMFTKLKKKYRCLVPHQERGTVNQMHRSQRILESTVMEHQTLQHRCLLPEVVLGVGLFHVKQDH